MSQFLSLFFLTAGASFLKDQPKRETELKVILWSSMRASLPKISGMEEEGWPFQNTQNPASVLTHATKSSADEDTNYRMNRNASFPPSHLPWSIKLYVLRAGTTLAHKLIFVANPAAQPPSQHLSIFKTQARIAPGKKNKFYAKTLEILLVIIGKCLWFFFLNIKDVLC